MLTWLLNRPNDADRVPDEDPAQEPPETPAPVFAARALKSAIFGTPAPPADDTVLDIKAEAPENADRNIRDAQGCSMSPTKPQGILLTPGTATARRKTVSFGAEVSDTTNKRESTESKSKTGEPKVPGHVERYSNKTQRKTPFTRSLELAREPKSGGREDPKSKQTSSRPQPLIDFNQNKSGIEETVDVRPSSADSSTSQSSNKDLLLELVAGAEPDGDMTLDLNEPHSQSGKYWKSEYDQYHGEAKTEMEKLLKYKQLAKSYAKKKDTETLKLTEKLKDEQRRIVGLEDKISKLYDQLDAIGIGDNNDGSPDLVKELAKQTALARRYKSQVDELRAGGNEKFEAKAPQYQEDQGRATLVQEMGILRKELSSERKTSSRLREENAKLTQELFDASLRLEEQESRSERRRLAVEEHLKKKSEAYETLQQEYDSMKEKAKAQRGSAEQLLKEKHDQTVMLRKEIAALKQPQVLADGTQQQTQHRRSEDKLAVSPRRIQSKLSKDMDNIPAQKLDSPRVQDRDALLASKATPSLTLDSPLVRDREVLVASNRLPSLETKRARSALPPARAAAARARLEKKYAEKRKLQELDWNKENVEN